MSKLRQVKVDNWGAFFLQRLKNFFNRTDYCDLTLQFQDNVQLKVHRLVLNACTEYFEILERTCEMYEDCLIMPDDLQTDVMIPIINFMYTGQLDYDQEILEKLYQTSQIMNLTVLSKLLDVQCSENSRKGHTTPNPLGKRTYNSAFDKSNSRQTIYTPSCKSLYGSKGPPAKELTPYYIDPKKIKNNLIFEKKPTRYEVPPELEVENTFEESFSDISYDSKPLMVHPETRCYERKKPYHGIFSEASTSKKFDELQSRPSTSLDFVECKRIPNYNEVFEDENDDSLPFSHNPSTSQNNTYVNKDKLFDEVLEDQPKVTIEAKGSYNAEKLDHAKIISEVLKKYPHLVKSNKNIKLKILPPKASVIKAKSKKPAILKQQVDKIAMNKSPIIKKALIRNTIIKKEVEYIDMDSSEAEELIRQGVHNINGPWICMLCGAPGRYLLHNSYYEMRRHLVEVHQEKPFCNLCEYCGMKCMRRNYLLHHMYTKHGIEPPPTHKFPKCNKCNYIALTNGYLAKHKLTHFDTFRCNVCYSTYDTSNQLLHHIQKTGHKIIADRKQNFQCIYCMKQFLREVNLYTHLKIVHKDEASCDGILDNSDEEDVNSKDSPSAQVKQESLEYHQTDELEYEIQKDGYIHLVSKQHNNKQKILNEEFLMSTINQIYTPKNTLYVGSSHEKHVSNEDIKILSNKELIVSNKNQYIIPRLPGPSDESMIKGNEKMVINKKSDNINQSIQIVVSNQEEYNALINSNPSIIFDDSSPENTLTVLSSSNATLERNTSMNLDSSQNNEVVILQEEYPLNEAVSTDNGNIVVLYDPSDNSQKKYIVNDQFGQPELLETQNIGAQYVQTSAVITQNFETITTSTPMEGGQVLVQQPIISWPTNVHHEIISDQSSFSITVKESMPNVVELNKAEKEKITINAMEEDKTDNNTLVVIPADEIGNVETIDTSVAEEAIDNAVTMEHQTEEMSSNIEPMEVTTELEHKSIDKIHIQNKILLEWTEETNESESPVQVESSSDCVIEITKGDEALQIIETEEVNISTEFNLESSIAQKDVSNCDQQINEQQNSNKQLQTEPITINSKVKEKINSLLVEWDENDSQNDETSTVEVTSTQIEEHSLEKNEQSHFESNYALPPENDIISDSNGNNGPQENPDEKMIILNENTKVSQENIVVSDDNTQVTDENIQNSDENTQVSHEITQVSDEITQVSDEITQVADENLQANQVNTQVTEESTQVSDGEIEKPVSEPLKEHQCENVSSCDIDTVTNKPESTKKNVNTENNIKKLVSDWDEDDE